MITIPTAEQNAFQGSTPKDLILEFPIGRTLTNEDIVSESATLEQAICDESSLTFGSVYSSCFSVRIFDDGLTYTGLRVFPHISVPEDGTTYTRDLGEFTVKSDKLTSDKMYRDLVCYDALANVLPFDYAQWHNDRPASYTMKQYRDAFFSYIGIEQVSVTLPNDSVSLSQFQVEKVTGAEILGAILQLNGCFGYIGYDGKFKYIIPKTTVDYSISDGSYYQGSFDYEDEALLPLSGVTIKGYSDDYGENVKSVPDVTSGDSDGSVLVIENSFLIQNENESTRQSMCNALRLRLVGFTYYPAAIKFPVYIGLEMGDVFRIVTERKTVTFPVLKRTMSGISALNDALEAKGEGGLASSAGSVSGGTSSAAIAINQMRLSVAELLAGKASISQLNAQSAMIEELESDNVTINNTLTAHNAVIQTLDATYATINDLTVERGRVNDLYANKADVTQLNVASGKITTLESSYGNIVTLLSGNAGVGDLQAIHLTTSNAAIDAAVIRNIVSQYITVNDLVAGAIDTSKFIISSPDGRIEISGNTQKFKDSNGNVRMQIGQDAQGNFTFVLYDATGQGVLMDSSGIKPSAIADGLITDAKVAYNANISASKLDIGSLFSAINNDSNNVISASKIYLNEQEQTLVQMYTQFTTDIELANDNADDAVALAQQASANADAAIRAVEGIASLDNVTAVLSNDSHVVHTNYDGTGGSYTFANTKVSAYKGDADISSQVTITYTASQGLFGTWNASARVYQVTALTTDDGYVDFEVTYTPAGGTSVVTTKRFSISKSPDGRAGSAYNLQVSANVLQKSKQGAFSPASLVLTAVVSVGSQSGAYSGKFKVEESLDNSTWEEKYVSQSVEGGTVYYPTVWANFIRCTLMDENNSYLDAQTVTIIADTNELAGDLVVTNSAVLNLDERMGTVETGVGGLRVDLQTTREQLQGVSDNTFFYTVQSDYSQADTVNLSAHLYREKRDIHDQFPPEWFTWHKKTEEGIVAIGSGYTIQIRRSDYGFGGTVVGRFSAFEESLLALPNGDHMVTPNGLRLAAYYM